MKDWQQNIQATSSNGYQDFDTKFVPEYTMMQAWELWSEMK